MRHGGKRIRSLSKSEACRGCDFNSTRFAICGDVETAVWCAETDRSGSAMKSFQIVLIDKKAVQDGVTEGKQGIVSANHYVCTCVAPAEKDASALA